MFKHTTIILGMVMGLFQSSAFATLQPIIEVTSDKYPGSVFYIGVDVDDQFNVTNFYYQDEKRVVTYYNFKQMAAGVVLVKEQGRDVIVMDTDYDAATRSSSITFTYLTNGIWGRHSKAFAQLGFNTHTQRYEFTDPDDNHVVSGARIVSRRLGNKIIGISTIDLN